MNYLSICLDYLLQCNKCSQNISGLKSPFYLLRNLLCQEFGKGLAGRFFCFAWCDWSHLLSCFQLVTWQDLENPKSLHSHLSISVLFQLASPCNFGLSNSMDKLVVVGLLPGSWLLEETF